MFAIHDRVGDPAPAGEGAVQQGMARIAPENANATFNAKMQDPAWRAKAKTPGTMEHRESEQLQRLIAQDRVSKQNRA
jgi:hypothetical protein